MEDGFAAALHALALEPVPLSDDQAREFLQQHPLDVWFRELSGAHVPQSTLDDVATAFAKIFNTEFGASLLPHLLPHAEAALQSPSTPLRRLAVQQLGRVLALQAQPPQRCLDLLLAALQDGEVGVASAAEAALAQLGRPQAAAQAPLALLLSGAHAWGGALARLAACGDPLLRLRALSLAVALAAQSPAAAAAVHESGLLGGLLRELEDTGDPLTCMAALQLLRDAAERCDPRMAAALQAAVLPRLRPLLLRAEPLLQGAALRAAAALLARQLEAEAASTELDSPQAAPASGVGGGEGEGGAGEALLLPALKRVLDVAGADDVAPELAHAALDAVSILGQQARGAEALLRGPAAVAADVAHVALGRAPSPALRAEALHALAAVAGAERLGGRSRQLLGEEAEAALRVAVFEGAASAWPGATPAEVLAAQLAQPFAEQRVAGYRCLAALAARDWAAGQVCGHEPLLAAVLDPAGESGQQGCEWRHACAAALSATICDVAAGGIGAGGPHAEPLLAAAQRVAAAVRGGPYGAGAGGQEQQVATAAGA